MKNRLLKSQNGAIVIEAVIVMPIVIVVILILLYMSFFEVQKSMMFSKAQKLSQEVCNIINFPGYNNICDEETLSRQEINDTYKVHDPYRYLFGVSKKKYEIYEDVITKEIKDASFINGNIETKIKSDFKNLSTAVQVDITFSYKMPAFVEIVGTDRNISFTTSAVTYANDTTEFIRNTDIAFDMVDFLLDKLGIKDKAEVFYGKMMSTIKKFKN